MREFADYTDAFAAERARLEMDDGIAEVASAPRRAGRVLRPTGDDDAIALTDLGDPLPINPDCGSSGRITIAQTRAFLKAEAEFIPTEPIRWRKNLSGEIVSNSFLKPKAPPKRPDGRLVVLMKHPPKHKRFTKLSNRDR